MQKTTIDGVATALEAMRRAMQDLAQGSTYLAHRKP